MAMVMPRSRSSGALSIESKARYSALPFRARYLEIAAVRLVLPWSMWPIVPILTWGLVRSNFFLATRPSYSLTRRGCAAVTDFRGLSATWGGAHNRTRTDDLFLTKEVLCQLSYVGPGPIVRCELIGGQGGNRTPTAEGGWSTASGAHHLLNLPTVAAAPGRELRSRGEPATGSNALEPTTGLEPGTCCLQNSCSTN